ncbi:MAG: hypothetical protein GIX03_14780, partial [Candidatus Eremiobacteraeota bacterium]|nr:hypothetical protein [Candidatus Eremiobacteraeota bacterium]
AVKLAEQIGIDRVIEYAHRMGISAKLEPNLSLALGSSVVSPLDQATGYATLADQGIHVDASPIRLVRDAFGSPVLDNRIPQETEVVSAGTAYIMTSLLEGVITEGTGYPNADIGRPAAGKTGTTTDFRDAWFVGYTPDLVAAVWLGNDDYSRMNESYGGNIPARTWARFMKAALAHTPKHEFTYPSGELSKLAYCGESKRYEYFLDGTQPDGSCAYAGWAGREHTADVAPPAASEPVVARAMATPQPLPTFVLLSAEPVRLPSDPPEAALTPEPESSEVRAAALEAGDESPEPVPAASPTAVATAADVPSAAAAATLR